MVPDLTHTASPAPPPSSLPIVDNHHNLLHVDGQGSSVGSLVRRSGSALSPEIARLPPARAPRTPASVRSRYRDTSSDYYTAAWGSPYEVSPSPSARTALSEQPQSDEFESSPGPSFGLEHLLPSRLVNFGNPRPAASPFTRESSTSRTESEQAEEETPRSRTKKWVQLPQRQYLEKPRWWSESEHSISESDLGPISEEGPPKAERNRRSHKWREENRTLDQQLFLDLLRDNKPGSMEGINASRWATTPPTVTATHLKQARHMSSDKENIDERPQATAASEQMSPESIIKTEEDSGVEKEQMAPAVSEVKAVNESEHETAFTAPIPRESVFLQPPRMRKRVSWRGKNIVISIPKVDHEASGIIRPMTPDEVRSRLRRFEDAGYDLSGFDVLAGEGQDGPVQARQIFPPDEEGWSLPVTEKLAVNLPDLQKWKTYMDALTEAKLAALGVSLGDPEPPLPSQQQPLQSMARQTSGPYPALPFSPPIPTSSAGSMSKPQMLRGHSHTLSMASPSSPLNGPFGHMHRHSTFHGPMGFSQIQLQQYPQQPVSRPPTHGTQSFSPQKQFAHPDMPRIGSPAHMAALRNDFGNARGPGSPLTQQMLPQTPQDYSRQLMQDQQRRQHGYSQSVQQAPTQMPNPAAFMQQRPSMQQTPVLPELPEDENEELEEREEAELSAYVPLHERASLHAGIAVPTPRGHQHNISEGFERDILEAEQRLDIDRHADALDHSAVQSADNDPIAGDRTESSVKSHKKTASRLNVAAPAFNFNPGAIVLPPQPAFNPVPNFQPSQTSAFSFGAPVPKPNGHQTVHTRKPSSGSFNVAAPSFKPSQGAAPPSSDFSFSANGPPFDQNAPKLDSLKMQEQTVAHELPSIFGKVTIPDIVKPAKKSKAVAIVRPRDNGSKEPISGTEYEDDEGRLARSDDRQKRQRFGGDDGDEVPQFAEPTYVPLTSLQPMDIMTEQEEVPTAATPDVGVAASSEKAEADTKEALDEIAAQGVETVDDAIKRAEDEALQAAELITLVPRHGHKSSSSLSALARPFEPPVSFSVAHQSKSQAHQTNASISELEDGEVQDEDQTHIPPLRSQDNSSDERMKQHSVHIPQKSFYFPASERIGEVSQAEPSFDEIDAVMRQLNDTEVEPAVEGHDIGVSPLPSPGYQPVDGVTYLPHWARSDAPSPSPKRQAAPYQTQHDSSFTVHDRTDSGERAINGWPNVHRLNKAEDVPTSDWSGVLSPPDEERLPQRSSSFDSRIDDVIGRVVERRLQPLEASLRSISSTVNRRIGSPDMRTKHRSSSAIESDADDEDEVSENLRRRPVSRGRDQRLGQLKAVVLEALREQSPRRSQSSYDILDLHSALADMKVSFARAASASLELDDIRAVVEDVMSRQSQAIVPIALEEGTEHKRQVSELEGRLNDTLAGAIEEANHRHAIEEREAETSRLLRLAEEELGLLRAESRDDGSRVHALEDERQDLLRRIEKAAEAQRNTEDELRGVQDENEAMQGTLEEYRLSSTKWRNEIDDASQEREDLQNTIGALERQVEEAEESSSSMRRRLEKLHSDMSTAAGQLASEKASWKAREEDYRGELEAFEMQQTSLVREKAALEEEARMLRMSVVETNEAKLALDHSRSSNVSLGETIRKLQADFHEQQSLAARFEREIHDVRETGRAEVQRTKMAMETEIEVANHQVNVIRTKLERELSRLRTDLDRMNTEAETAKARHEFQLQQEADDRRDALRKVNLSCSVALDEARRNHEAALADFHATHSRSLNHAVEDKQRSEYILNERLALSDAKLRHYQDRVLYLEERLEIAKSAAQAAAVSAQSSTPQVATGASGPTSIPERVSPQALRESILVLQEQLQEREARIDELKHQVNDEGPAKLRERDTEIAWLRELLSVRGEELTELVNTLSRPTYDRDSVRDIAIRIRANLQMEQQEKDRLGYGGPSLSGQAIASLSSFATPKLTSAFNKWRSSMESTTLKGRAPKSLPMRSYTPSKSVPAPKHHSSYTDGLMTPPASNLRSISSPQATVWLPAPRLHGRVEPRHAEHATTDPGHPALFPDLPLSPSLFREQSYDQDAEDSNVQAHTHQDDDLNVPDSEPPAFRTLEAEFEPNEAAD